MQDNINTANNVDNNSIIEDIKKLNWFYCADIERRMLDPEESRHLKVKRITENEHICLFNEEKIAIVKIIALKKQATFEIQKIITKNTENSTHTTNITIATAIPKGDRADWMLEKLTELGVNKIIPLKTQYSTVDPRVAKQERWKRIVIEACKQSKNPHIPIIEKQMSFEAVLKLKFDHKIILHQDGSAAKKISGSILVIIGPEGGFSPEELELATKAGCHKIKIAENVLRIETAAIIGCAVFWGLK